MKVSIAAAFALIFGLGHSLFAADKPADRLLPVSTLVYVELKSPKALLQYLDHPMFQVLQASEPYKQATAAPEYRAFIEQLAAIEKDLGGDWRSVIEAAGDEGVHLAFDPATRGGALLLKSSNAAQLEKVRDVAVAWARKHAQAMGQGDPVQVSDYRGITGHFMGNQAGVAVFGPWLLVTNSRPLGQSVFDRYLEGDRPSLADDAEYQSAREKASKNLAGWGYVKIKLLRDIGLLLGVLPAKSNNVAAELLLGGVLGVLNDSPYGTFEIQAEPDSLDLSILLPHNPARYPVSRAFYFAPEGEPSLSPSLVPRETILSIHAYRDVAGMWKASPDLFDENVATSLAQADSQLSNFFGGRSFSGEILGNIGPRWQFLAARARFDPAAGPVPAIKLPAMAMVVQLQDPQLMQPYMKIAFQTFIGIINIQAGMSGNPAFLVSNEQRGDATFMNAVYLAMTSDQGRTDAPLYYNFEPTLVLVGDRLILTSNKSLAEELLELFQKPQAITGLGDNTRVSLSSDAALAAMEDNKAQLVALTMIQQGSDRVSAEQALGFAFDALRMLREVELKLTPKPGLLKLKLGLKLTPTP